MKGKHEVRVEIKLALSDQDIEDLMVTALESGIGYWACLDNRSDTFRDAPDDEPVSITASKILLNGGGLTFLDDEDHSIEWVLTLKKLLSGIKKFLENEGGSNCIMDGELDLGMIDAQAADNIVQYALFNELVYG